MSGGFIIGGQRDLRGAPSALEAGADVVAAFDPADDEADLDDVFLSLPPSAIAFLAPAAAAERLFVARGRTCKPSSGSLAISSRSPAE